MNGQAGREMTGVERLIGDDKNQTIPGQPPCSPERLVPTPNRSQLERIGELEQRVSELQTRVRNHDQAFTELVKCLISQVGLQI